MLDQRFVPGHPEISVRKPRRRRWIIQADFHPKTFEVGETHGQRQAGRVNLRLLWLVILLNSLHLLDNPFNRDTFLNDCVFLQIRGAKFPPRLRINGLKPSFFLAQGTSTLVRFSFRHGFSPCFMPSLALYLWSRHAAITSQTRTRT